MGPRSRAAIREPARPWTATGRSEARNGRSGKGAFASRLSRIGRAGLRAGVSTREVIHLTDLLPTFVAAAGGEVDPAWHVDGTNLLAVWTGKASVPERTLFWEWRSEGSNQLAGSRGPFKLVVTRGGKPELFDVEADPAERRDISAAYPELTRQLRAELDAWLETETRR